MSLSKAQVRAWARRRRGKTDLTVASQLITRALVDCGLLRGTVLTYMALPDEVNLSRLPSAVPAIRWAVTRTPDRGLLTVHLLSSEMEQHAFGFAQPVAGSPRLPEEAVDVVLVPGMAFDRRGVRLGWGAGHYDRMLAGMRPDCLRIGVTPAALIRAELPVECHDVAMTHLASEDGVVAVPGPDHSAC